MLGCSASCGRRFAKKSTENESVYGIRGALLERVSPSSSQGATVQEATGIVCYTLLLGAIFSLRDFLHCSVTSESKRHIYHVF